MVGIGKEMRSLIRDLNLEDMSRRRLGVVAVELEINGSSKQNSIPLVSDFQLVIYNRNSATPFKSSLLHLSLSLLIVIISLEKLSPYDGTLIMATSSQRFILIAFIFLMSTTIGTAINDNSSNPSVPPSSATLFDHQEHTNASTYLLATILTDLGFQELATVVPSLSATAWKGPTTIFAPTDSALLTCTSCSVPLLLQEHAVPGLFPLDYLRTLAFGTKIETLSPGRCMTITSTSANNNTTKIFVGGVEITHPDLFNNGLVVVHGLQGFLSHLSPLSCNIERMTSLSFPQPPLVPAFLIMPMMLKDAMLRLHISGYNILSLALKVKYSHLLDLRNMTVFALDDVSIFSGGHAYLSDFRFHIVPNRLLMAADLESLPPGTVLPTMEQGQELVVTTAGGRGPLTPMRINYVKIKNPDLMYNLKIAIHGVSMPFPHFHPAVFGQIGRSVGNPEMEAPMAGIGSTVEMEDHHFSVRLMR
ncbi:hypothetical protein F0562_001935 [Nyssa sinensis]|uniref:FAS1 domain-containing protein n=1 Tax=Nyssa sinensis TaxID=561372 RepID=A0A5J5C9F5_9ASTE|nr:hypothetical protein F0562_001935 [Nyssa sinensis]